MQIIDRAFDAVTLIEPRLFRDARGYFFECYNEAAYGKLGLPTRFVQDNISRSVKHTLRGLHYQLEPHAQGKLVTANTGKIFDVVVDIRRGSPTFGKWTGFELTGDNRRALYVPPGFAHGFIVLSDEAEVTYKCTAYYAPGFDRGIRWDDPQIAVDWPSRPGPISDKDRDAPGLDGAEINFVYQR